MSLENGFAKEFAEKNVISNNALTGIHYWKHGKYFVDSATKLIESNNTTNNEFYVSATYNYLVDKLKIGTYKVSTSEFHPIGTPYDLEKYRYDTWKII